MNFIEYKNTEFRVRTVSVDGETWFVAKDVCDVLGLDQVSRALDGLHDDERGVTNSNPIIDRLGREQDASIVSESGLYALIFKSRKPEAQLFRRWVTGEVLPAIRRDGYYQMAKLDQSRIKQLETEIEQAKQRVEKKEDHLWRVQHVEGNVTIKMYLDAAGIDLGTLERMRLGARLKFRARVCGFPVGYVKQRRTKKGMRLAAGYQRVATFPPQHLAAEVVGLGHAHPMPARDRLASVMQDWLGTRFLDPRLPMHQQPAIAA